MDHTRLTGPPAGRPRAVLLLPAVFALVPMLSMLWSARGNLAEAPLALIGFLIFAALPFVVLAALLLATRTVRWLWRSALIYTIAAGLFGVVFCVSILTSESSTAVIGFVFLPLYQLIGIGAAVLIGALVAWVAARRR